eukprot:COSAG01_NODE_15864_length_1291_cov_1.436242_1_plen_136_part_00
MRACTCVVQQWAAQLKNRETPAPTPTPVKQNGAASQSMGTHSFGDCDPIPSVWVIGCVCVCVETQTQTPAQKKAKKKRSVEQMKNALSQFVTKTERTSPHPTPGATAEVQKSKKPKYICTRRSRNRSICFSRSSL